MSNCFVLTVDSGLPLNSPGLTVDGFDGALIEGEIDRVLTQYRESPKLLGMIRAYLRQVYQAAVTACGIPSYFDIADAVGEQLTLIGKRMGFPRCHCICEVAPVFGFACPGYNGPYKIAGFCEPGSSWINCAPVGDGELCITDDDVYRGMLLARRYQMMGLYDIASLQAAAQHIWGMTASVADSGGGKVVVATGRALTDFEEQSLQIAFRVLPVAPGVKALVSKAAGPVFGFGEGWGGFCENAEWLCPTDPYAYTCP